MKKNVAAIGILMVSLLLTACGNRGAVNTLSYGMLPVKYVNEKEEERYAQDTYSFNQRGVVESTVSEGDVKPEVKSLFAEFCRQKGYGSSAKGCLTDLTHDGVEELLVVLEKPDGIGEMHIYTVSDGDVKELYTLENSNMRLRYYLCTVEGKAYLVEYVEAVYTGRGTVSYNVGYLSEAGEWINHDSGSLEVDFSESDYQPGEKEFNEKLDSYRNNGFLAMWLTESKLGTLGSVLGL